MLKIPMFIYMYYIYTNVYRDVALQDGAFLIIIPAGRGLKVLNK